MESCRSRHESQVIAGTIGKIRNVRLRDFMRQARVPRLIQRFLKHLTARWMAVHPCTENGLLRCKQSRQFGGECVPRIYALPIFRPQRFDGDLVVGMFVFTEYQR